MVKLLAAVEMESESVNLSWTLLEELPAEERKEHNESRFLFVFISCWAISRKVVMSSVMLDEASCREAIFLLHYQYELYCVSVFPSVPHTTQGGASGIISLTVDTVASLLLCTKQSPGSTRINYTVQKLSDAFEKICFSRKSNTASK